jgi:hypothetical protein
MISPANLAQTRYWLERFSDIYDTNVPMVLHTSEIDGNGAPQWSPQFRDILTAEDNYKDTPSEVIRLRRAMKWVRQNSLRESEVLRRALVMKQTVQEITDWLNWRAVRGGYPERYSVNSTTVILFAAVDKLSWAY